MAQLTPPSPNMIRVKETMISHTCDRIKGFNSWYSEPQSCNWTSFSNRNIEKTESSLSYSLPRSFCIFVSFSFLPLYISLSLFLSLPLTNPLSITRVSHTHNVISRSLSRYISYYCFFSFDFINKMFINNILGCTLYVVCRRMILIASAKNVPFEIRARNSIYCAQGE